MAPTMGSCGSAPGKLCDSCQQRMGENDMYAFPREVPIRWNRFKTNPATGEREPDGHECQACEDKLQKHMCCCLAMSSLNCAECIFGCAMP